MTTDEIKTLVHSIDYSEALTLTAGEKEVREACAEAKQYGFRAVVAFPQYLGIIVDELKGSGVRAQIPVGFPSGGQTTAVKCVEAEEGLKRGASDLDMVMNLSAFRNGNYSAVEKDIRAIMKIAEPYGIPFKVIIEVGLLSDEQIVTAAKLVKECGADFVKTCTGFGPGRATGHIISLIRETVGPEMGIKASGGVASIEDGVAYMKFGATVVAMRRMLVDQLSSMGWKT
jgi:deoxyribose-phosphate aldolase